MEFGSIASGSSGNSIMVRNSNTAVLIDAGVSGKTIESGLNVFDMTSRDIDAIFVTHEHSDHIKGLGVMARKLGCPIYATKGTIRVLKQMKSLGKIDPGLYREVSANEEMTFNGLNILPMPVAHDAADPVSYVIETPEASGMKKIAITTDLGEYTDEIISHLRDLDAILLESNHDENMLMVGSYPYVLKQRILGKYGHLSNSTAGRLLSEILHDNMKHILLGHISGENNYPDLALETVKLEISMADNKYKRNDFDIQVASREMPSELMAV